MDEGDRWYNTLEGGRKWPKLLHMAQKTPKNTKKTREEHVKKGGGRGGGSTSSLGTRVF